MKLGQQIPQKANQNGKGSVKSSESERHKGFLTIKPKEWNDIDDKKLKESGKERSQSFDNHMYILTGTEGPEKFYHLVNRHPKKSY